MRQKLIDFLTWYSPIFTTNVTQVVDDYLSTNPYPDEVEREIIHDKFTDELLDYYKTISQPSTVTDAENKKLVKVLSSLNSKNIDLMAELKIKDDQIAKRHTQLAAKDKIVSKLTDERDELKDDRDYWKSQHLVSHVKLEKRIEKLEDMLFKIR